MLSTMRSQKKILSIFLWLVIAAFIGTIFFAWGVGEKVQNANYVAKVDDTVIGQAQFQNAYENTLATLQQLFGEQANQVTDTDALRIQVANDLIEEVLLAREADKMKVPVSDAEVAGYISSISSFQINGQFDAQRYVEVLSSNRLTPAKYEASVRRSLTVDKMRAIIEGAVTVTDEEVQKEYDFRNTRARISYVPVDPAKFAGTAMNDATDETLLAYYEENREAYRTPVEIKVNYVSFNPDSFDANLAITDSDIETYYIQHQDEFSVEETVTARHILVRVPDWNDESVVKSARSKIEGLHKQVQAGKDFAELARQFSEDGSAANGGDLGTFGRGQMVPEFEEAAFALDAGEVSGIVKTQFGFHLIKVSEHVQPKDPSLEEVSDQIRERLAEESAEAQFRQYVIGVYRDVIKASNLSAYAAKDNVSLDVKTTDFFSMDDTNVPFVANPQVAATLFALEVSEVSQVISIGDTQYIFEIAARHESSIPAFEDVKADVRRDYIDVRSIELAIERASELSSGTLAEASRALGVAVEKPDAFTRAEPIPGIGAENALTEQIFDAEAGTMLVDPFVGEEVVYLVQVDDIMSPDPAGLEEQYSEIVEYLKPIKQDSAYASYVDTLRQDAEIDINPAFQRP